MARLAKLDKIAAIGSIALFGIIALIWFFICRCRSGGGGGEPGDSAGSLTLTGNLTLQDGALLDFELGTVEGSDKISMSSSTLNLNGQQFEDFTFTALSGFGGGIYTLIDAGTIAGNLGTILSGTISGLPATLAVSGNDLVLHVVPEPGVWVLLGMAVVGWLVGRRGRSMRWPR